MNSFSSKAVLTSGNRSYTFYRLPALAERGKAEDVDSSVAGGEGAGGVEGVGMRGHESSLLKSSCRRADENARGSGG